VTLTAQRLHTLLAPRPLRFFEQVDSTNDVARAWLNEGVASGAVVIADEQHKGRGRMGRTWHTPPGVALAISMILKPPVNTLSQVSMLGALAIAELCEYTGLDQVGIKWPNDVQVNGRKVSGVLPEAVWDGDQLLGVILGMGINIRLDFADTELADTAVSIEPALGKPVDRAELAAYLLERVDFWFAKLGQPTLFSAWKKRLTTLGNTVTVTHLNSTLHGVAEAVDESGALLIKIADGTQQWVRAGDIALQ
jgi:BirA family transcriptional regulator, biotin operon repressor / biotin---[acetyl-CoA-carboxylase] ligase